MINCYWSKKNLFVWNRPNKNKKLVKVYQLKIQVNCAGDLRLLHVCCLFGGGDKKICRGISKRIIEKLGNYARIVFFFFN